MSIIGLVTYFDGNYGSMLQCYSTKNFLEKTGNRCMVLSETITKEKILKYYLGKSLDLASDFITHPRYYKIYKQLRKSSKRSGEMLSLNSQTKMKYFVKAKIQPFVSDYDTFCEIAQKNEFKCFISGSDQIWNCSVPLNKFFFLRFAPQAKRFALAPSLGVDKLPDYNAKRLKKYILEYKTLSVREKQGQEIISELLHQDVQVLGDPVILKTADEWRKEYDCYVDSKKKRPYIVLFFLDKPNETAIKSAELIAKEHKLQLVQFGYHHDLPIQTELQDGGPFDWINAIDNAEYVLTDSFHAALFSIIFDKEFFVFKRQYKHAYSQESRLLNLLEKYGYQERLISDKMACVSAYRKHNCEKILKAERAKISKFILKILADTNCLEAKKIQDGETCYGCDACYYVCKKQAIFKAHNMLGSHYYVINSDKCVNCGICSEVCYYTVKNKYPKKGYVVYNEDEEIRKLSASGGAFSAIATDFIKAGGVVYGSSLFLRDNNITVEHIRVDNLFDLGKILGSKYVQSNMSQIYYLVKDDLEKGKKVLFSGTSCQIHAIKACFEDAYHSNLYTLDLVCHGVPGNNLFSEYIEYLQLKEGGKVVGIKFRKKTDGIIDYVMAIDMVMPNGTKQTLEIPAEESSYYYMFLRGENYRNSCYHCQYATIDKPSDITIGDYFELQEDYPQIYEKLRDKLKDFSCMITHSKKGEELSSARSLIKIEVDPLVIQRSHKQLLHPSIYTSFRVDAMRRYNKSGYAGLNSFFVKHQKLSKVVKKGLSIMRGKKDVQD